MIADKRKFILGLVMMVIFIAVLIFLFMPVFNNQNAMQYLDSLYNSISKGSAYYIPKVKAETDTLKGRPVTLNLPVHDEKQALQTQKLLGRGGARVELKGDTLKVTGDLGLIMENCLSDADAMYYNNGDKIRSKYGYDERRVMFNWAEALETAEKDLKRQKKFREAKTVGFALEKAVEASYNYYKVEPQSIMDRLGVVIFSLVFYVIYTLWYGFAIMYMFEGWGMQLEH